MSSRMRWRSSRLMFCALNLPSFLFPDCAAAIPAASESSSARSGPFMVAGMFRGFAFEGVSPLPKFVTMYCPMPELKTRILVVDDDQRLRDLLVRYLGGEGYEVKAVPDASGMDKQLARERYDLVVLDLMLPGEDGLAICRRLRAQNSAPAIIMLTAKGDDVDRIRGLELGADDYLPKPFNPRELLARIRAVLRRAAAPPPGVARRFRTGELEVDFDTREVMAAGRRVLLTQYEFELLAALARAAGRVLTRE